jgi:hypothetical protein
MKRIFIVFLLPAVFLLTACNSKKKRLIPKDDLVNILVEMNIANSLGNDYIAKSKFRDLDSATVYRMVFDNSGYTKAQFDSTMNYYTRHPQTLDKIYDRVIAKLSMKEDETANEFREKESKKKK